MDVMKGKWKKNIFIKTWERCKSQGSNPNKFPNNPLTKSKSCNHFSRNHLSRNQYEEEEEEQKSTSSKSKVAPQGYFTVYVGEEKQRFVVKTEYANHPMFKLLLDDAEMEYGYNCDGPIILPCDVELFFKVLAQMECGNDDDDDIRVGCSNFSPVCGSSNGRLVKGFGSYRALNSSPMVRINKF